MVLPDVARHEDVVRGRRAIVVVELDVIGEGGSAGDEPRVDARSAAARGDRPRRGTGRWPPARRRGTGSSRAAARRSRPPREKSAAAVYRRCAPARARRRPRDDARRPAAAPLPRRARLPRARRAAHRPSVESAGDRASSGPVYPAAPSCDPPRARDRRAHRRFRYFGSTTGRSWAARAAGVVSGQGVGSPVSGSRNSRAVLGPPKRNRSRSDPAIASNDWSPRRPRPQLSSISRRIDPTSAIVCPT